MTGQECGGTHRLGKSGRASLTLCQKEVKLQEDRGRRPVGKGQSCHRTSPSRGKASVGSLFSADFGELRC